MSPKSKPTAERHQFQFATDTADPTVALAEAIASVTDRDPLDLPPLYETVDTIAFGRLVSSSDDVTISFEVDGLDVLVDGTGKIVVAGQ
ncbi:hypothetical protein CV102_02650 [Natronococcus pandeyae]|uniref:Halobacterial output domain-containing protein n=2 Tax=Natronococcus pandeyae TaxID=2055836 RepID=A0A8J8Q7E3_9EURY|nr:hypothetical protein CV102_02650 [Natronococcus pandeyae]